MLIGAFAILAISALRHSIWFALIMPPILTRHLGALDIAWGRVADWRLSKVLQGWTADRRVRRSRYRWNAGLASIMVLLVVMQSPWIRPRLYGTSLVSAMTPIGAMDFIERQQLSGNILHPQVYGDYLMWRLWPKQKSFFDGRVHVFGEEFVRFYQEIFADTQWENFLAKYDIRYLLLSKDESEAGSVRMIEAAHTSGRWRTLYEDSLSVLLEDREGKTAEIGMSLD